MQQNLKKNEMRYREKWCLMKPKNFEIICMVARQTFKNYHLQMCGFVYYIKERLSLKYKPHVNPVA